MKEFSEIFNEFKNFEFTTPQYSLSEVKHLVQNERNKVYAPCVYTHRQGVSRLSIVSKEAQAWLQRKYPSSSAVQPRQ